MGSVSVDMGTSFNSLAPFIFLFLTESSRSISVDGQPVAISTCQSRFFLNNLCKYIYKSHT